MAEFGTFAGQVGFVLAFMGLAYLFARLMINAQLKSQTAESETQRATIQLAAKAIDNIEANTRVTKELGDYIKHMDERRLEMHNEVIQTAHDNNLMLQNLTVISTDTNIKVGRLLPPPLPSLLIED